MSHLGSPRFIIRHIFGLHSLIWHRVPKTLGICCHKNDKGVFCHVNEMTFGKPPGHLEMGLPAWGHNHVIRRSALTVPPHLREGSWNLRSVTKTDDVIHHASVRKPPPNPSGTLLQYSCLGNPMDGGAWKAAVHRVAECRTRLSDFPFTFHFHALEKEMATHSSVLALRIPGPGEPGELLSMGSHRVGHD